MQKVSSRIVKLGQIDSAATTRLPSKAQNMLRTLMFSGAQCAFVFASLGIVVLPVKASDQIGRDTSVTPHQERYVPQALILVVDEFRRLSRSVFTTDHLAREHRHRIGPGEQGIRRRR